jgi:hypothetical protein
MGQTALTIASTFNQQTSTPLSGSRRAARGVHDIDWQLLCPRVGVRSSEGLNLFEASEHQKIAICSEVMFLPECYTLSLLL